MTVSKSQSVALVFGALVTAVPALGEDLIPPPWPRFSPGSTVQHWDFSSGPVGGAPDAGPLFNPFGTPLFTPSDQNNWLPTFAGHNAVWAVNDFDPLHFFIPNGAPFSHAVKDLWLQVTYLSGPPLTFGINFNSQFGPATLVGAPIITVMADGWIHEASLWRFHGCPESETLTITPPVPGTVVFIDQVVIDTSCYVPAPAALAPLVIGLCLRRRRR